METRGAVRWGFQAALANRVPFGPVFREAGPAGQLVHGQAEREHVGLCEVGEVLLQDLVGKVTAIALLDLGLFDAGHVTEVAW